MPRPAASRGDALTRALAPFSPALPLAVAYSGGADSTALLVLCARRWPGQVAAIHVHHGLQVAADDFERHCAQTCTALGVPLAVQRVDVRHTTGQSPEEAARKARYGALALALRSPVGGLQCKSLALAQHADDQLETILLALSRGAGLPGLSGMRATWVVEGATYHRPLLQVAANDIRDWLAAAAISFVDDPSNSNEGFTRNRIRARLLPALDATFEQARVTFARSATHAAQAQLLLDEVAQHDMRLLRGSEPGRLLIAGLRTLSRPRLANLLRHWLKSDHGSSASAAQLDELQGQIMACATRGQQIQIKVGAGVALRRGSELAWYNLAFDPGASR